LAVELGGLEVGEGGEDGEVEKVTAGLGELEVGDEGEDGEVEKVPAEAETAATH